MNERAAPWVTGAVYGIVLAAGLYYAVAGLGAVSPLRTAGFGACVLALFAVEPLAARFDRGAGAAVGFLLARVALFAAAAALDGSGLSRALFVLVPFLAYLSLGRVAGLVAGGVCLAVLVAGFAVWVPGWYRDAVYVSDLLMFGMGVVLAVAMADVVTRERRAAARVGELSAAAERNRVARDIHDSLGHHLTAISIQLEKAAAFRPHDPDIADRAVADARKSARLALEDVRASVGALRSPVSLTTALADLLTDDDTPTVTLRIEGTERPTDQATVTTLFRAAQEALTNTRRHAAATRVTITITFTPHDLTLTIHDNGRGFASPTPVESLHPPAHPEGFGLLGLRERAALVGGVVHIDSAPGAGTTITLRVAS
ncbi:signal transduction histidine kinase [Actinokineospora baliensis]|uniref:sensor histidine kinase n=1 Tax=Actinokineospora baliensis TaxID=547056 RepID=UPI0027DADBE4|nr:sensor histidine kinase [Actinokineospora baliensis]MBM7774404.1 signal transduction histidine kinase [Actinokineospora baliensis]